MRAARISHDERKVIEKLIHYGLNDQEIANELSRHRTSICREVTRNSSNRENYNADFAQYKCEVRKHMDRVKFVTENKTVIAFVAKNLKQFSPDVISGRSKLEDNNVRVSTESIYSIVYNDKIQGGLLYALLSSQRKHRKTSRFKCNDDRGILKNQVSIRFRPKGAENRSRNGHFEGDTILGKKHKSMIFAAIDRKNKADFAYKLSQRNSDGTFEAVKAMKNYYGDFFESLTVDNGKEFSCHERITEELGVMVYFADAGKPQQRGSSENFNRQLRRYFPKGVDFRNISQASVRGVMNKFNNTPRKSLNYRTPFEVIGFKQFRALLN